MKKGLSRRELLSATAGVVFASTASKKVFPAQEETPKKVSPNETFGIGIIGVGGQGGAHLWRLMDNPRAKILAVCDIYKPRLEAAAEKAGATPYHDYHELLNRKDIDCVWIATPDHWHSRMAIDAMNAGKDVYCEKPMARYWHEAKEFYQVAERTRRVVQIGSQATSQARWWKAKELIESGKLGKLVWSQTSIARNLRGGDWNYGIDLSAGSHNLDWKAFLGPADRRPFDPERFFRWRKYWDYSGGIATDLFSHVLHSICIPLGNPWPRRVVAGGGMYLHKDRETPDTFLMVVDYEGDHSVFAAGTQANEQGLPVVIRGHEASMYLSGSEVEIRPERIYSTSRGEELHKTLDWEDDILLHHENFLDCVGERNQNTNCNHLLGYKVDTAVDMSVEAWRRKTASLFDVEKQEVYTA